MHRYKYGLNNNDNHGKIIPSLVIINKIAQNACSPSSGLKIVLCKNFDHVHLIYHTPSTTHQYLGRWAKKKHLVASNCTNVNRSKDIEISMNLWVCSNIKIFLSIFSVIFLKRSINSIITFYII